MVLFGMRDAQSDLIFTEGHLPDLPRLVAGQPKHPAGSRRDETSFHDRDDGAAWLLATLARRRGMIRGYAPDASVEVTRRVPEEERDEPDREDGAHDRVGEHDDPDAESQETATSGDQRLMPGVGHATILFNNRSTGLTGQFCDLRAPENARRSLSFTT